MLFYLVISIIPTQLVSIFNKDPEILKIAPSIMRLFFFGMAFFGAQLATQALFMALGQAFVSLSMALLRKIIILIPLAFLLPIWFGLNGIYIAEVFADLLATILTVGTFVLLSNKILQKREIEKTFLVSNMK